MSMVLGQGKGIREGRDELLDKAIKIISDLNEAFI